MAVLDVTGWEPAGEESLGSKPKQWLRSPTGDRWLWKEATFNDDARQGVFQKGDDWAEVVAGRVGRALGLPVADVELAVRGSANGMVSRSVLVDDREQLVHGNELLAEAGVSTAGSRSPPGYTIDAVAAALDRIEAPLLSAVLASAFDWFAGYLVLDALVGNTDRHQDNWATIRRPGRWRLAPSFDHASCLGFLLSDADRVDRLEGRQHKRTVRDYSLAARTRFEGRPHPVFVAVEALRRCRPPVQRHWAAAIEAAPRLEELMDDMPADRMSGPARRFAAAVYAENRSSLADQFPTMTP